MGNRGGSLGRQLLGPIAALIATIAFGTVGYLLIEGWTFPEALYMSVMTIATVGFGEVRPLSDGGRYFTICLILVGLVGISYTISVITGMIVQGHLTQHWGRRRMERKVGQVSDHYIICGYGRVGRQTAEELKRERTPFVVIDTNQPSLDRAAADGLLVVYGNATEDEVLHRAGIDRARGLITAVANDADNIFVTLSARSLRPDMLIVARANYEDAVRKLRLAGATRVVSPYTMAGQQMALLAVRPAAVDFAERLLRGEGGSLLLEDVHVEPGSALDGISIAAARGRYAGGATLAAVQREGRLLAPPPDDLVLRADDIIAIVGADDQLRALERACLNLPDADVPPRGAPLPARGEGA
jgi:voltage-gated potassium channel